MADDSGLEVEALGNAPDGHEKTFAELDGATNNSLSHRDHALRRAAEAWHALLRQGFCPPLRGLG